MIDADQLLGLKQMLLWSYELLKFFLCVENDLVIIKQIGHNYPPIAASHVSYLALSLCSSYFQDEALTA
jgi:hypothetical protein